VIAAAIIGLGRWGRTLVGSVQGKSNRLRFTRAIVRSPEPHCDFAAAHGLGLSEDYDAVLADGGIDAVVIATPHSLHVDQVVAAAAAGKHVFCEKPLSLDTAEAGRAVTACATAGVVLGIGTDKRFHPAVGELIRLAKTGELGQPIHLEAHFSNEVAGSFSAWRFSPGESPAGGLTGTGIHMLDILIELAGPVHRVQAQLVSHKPPPDPLDSLAVLLAFESGIGGTLAMVRSTPGFVRTHVFARDGSVEMVDFTALMLRRRGQEPQRLTFAPVDTVRVNLDGFAEAAMGVNPYPITTRQILATAAASQAIVEAVKVR
jgi:predicted dehydrogenase